MHNIPTNTIYNYNSPIGALQQNVPAGRAFNTPTEAPNVKKIPSMFFPQSPDYNQREYTAPSNDTSIRRRQGFGEEDIFSSQKFTPYGDKEIFRSGGATSSPLSSSDSLTSKQGAPPSKSLYDEDTALPKSTPITQSTYDSIYKSSVISPLLQPEFVDVGSISATDEKWVTVFGFPPSTVSYILRQFQNYGDILQYKTEGSNFMHIQFQTKLQAQKALGKNGKDFGRNLKIGVIPYTPTETEEVPIKISRPTVINAPLKLPKLSNSIWVKISEALLGL